MAPAGGFRTRREPKSCTGRSEAPLPHSRGFSIVLPMDHDAAHKYIYALREVVADLLRLVVPDWADDLDHTTLEDLSAEFFDAEHRRRVGDMVWRVRFHEGMLDNDEKPYLLVLIEFQSTVDRHMAKRMREYTGLLRDRLIRNGAPEREGGLPWVLPLVVYNGRERWTAGGEASDLAPLPSARAEQELALLQPQTYSNSRSLEFLRKNRVLRRQEENVFVDFSLNISMIAAYSPATGEMSWPSGG